MSYTSIWKRYGCCDGPVNHSKGVGSSFVLHGYNYRTIPKWFRKTLHPIIPRNFEVNSDLMLYEFGFPEKANVEGGWHLRTSDDIFPRIYDRVSQHEMNVTRVSRVNGYSIWHITY